MKKNKKNFCFNKERGSFLFLAMVIISVVLASGIGASTILVRQLKKMNETEKAAVAFYVSESVSKETYDASGGEGDFIPFWDGRGRDLQYMVEDGDEGEEEITVKVDNDYYVFDKDAEEGEEEEEENGTITIYYSNPKERWTDVNARYVKYDNGVKIGSYTDISMVPSDYTNWVKYNIEGIEENIDELRFIFGVSESFTDGPYYIYKSSGFFPSCVSFSSVIFSSCKENTGNPSIYYDNNLGWSTAYLLYYKYSEGEYKGKSRDQMFFYGDDNWMKYDVEEELEEEDIDEIMIGFGPSEYNTTDRPYYIYKNDVSSGCFSSPPCAFYLFLE